MHTVFKRMQNAKMWAVFGFTTDLNKFKQFSSYKPCSLNSGIKLEINNRKIPIKISAFFFCIFVEVDKLITKFMWK